MSTRPTRNFPSTSEAKCPDCGATLSRGSDLKRHRKTQHPDGTEVKAHCPHSGCQYKTDQKSNLKAHIDARHSNQLRYRCPDCDKGFTDPAARIRHRKRTHGYKPYHTARYIARQSLKEAGQKSGKGVSNKTCDQQAVPHNTQNASSSAATLSKILTNTTYHDDFWKQIVDVPRRHASELKDSQDVQISVPVAAAPACGAPKTLHSDSDLSSPEVGQLQPSTSRECAGIYSLGSQLDITLQPQGQALAQSWTPYSHTIPVAASDHSPLAAAFPSSDRQTTYPSMGFQNLPTFSFANVPSSMPDPFTFPTTSTAPSSSRVSGHRFLPLDHMATPPLEPVPGLSWTPSLSPANSTPLSQPNFFTSEPDRGFNSWCQSYNFA
ncbi:hypothetical protein BJY52DRAFT_5288 [Lactarius psammicola]|nr:hypothetical protein BJY52DRAFT_5288 [Lactarius psammicola]